MGCMEHSVLYKASELSPEDRRTVEVLLGQPLDGSEFVTVKVSTGTILQEALTGQAADDAFQAWMKRVDETAKRVQGVPEEASDHFITHRLNERFGSANGRSFEVHSSMYP
jgi:hypothetical protein